MFSTLRMKCAGILRRNRDVLTAALVGIALILALVGGVQFCRHTEPDFWKSMLTTPEPERCTLCGTDGDGLRYHAPCLVNLATGEMGELTAYDPHRTLVGEIAEHQQTGVMCFQPCAGFVAMRDADAHTCRLSIPKSQESIAPAYFCRSCRAVLAEATTRGYALLDLYDLDEIQAFPVEDGAVYDIRDYTVSVEWDKDLKKHVIMVQGKLFLD